MKKILEEAEWIIFYSGAKVIYVFDCLLFVFVKCK